MTSGADAPRASRSETSLKPPSMLNADASARRPIQKMPNRRLSGKHLAGPDRVDVLRRQRDADDRQPASAAR